MIPWCPGCCRCVYRAEAHAVRTVDGSVFVEQGQSFHSHKQQDTDTDNACTRRYVEPVRGEEAADAVYPAEQDAEKDHPFVGVSQQVGRHLRNGQQADGQHDAYQSQYRDDGKGDDHHHSVFYQIDGQVLGVGKDAVKSYAEDLSVEENKDKADDECQDCQQPYVMASHGEYAAEEIAGQI